MLNGEKKTMHRELMWLPKIF